MEAITEIQAEAHGQPPKARPWEVKIKQQQTVIRGAWLTAAKQLQQSTEPDDQALAGGIRGFVAAMPKIDTERHEIKARLIERFSQHHEWSQENIADVAVAKLNTVMENSSTNDAGKDMER